MTALETKLTILSGHGHSELILSLTEDKTPTLQQSCKHYFLESIKYSLEVVISREAAAFHQSTDSSGLTPQHTVQFLFYLNN